jgi:hypothetical protein
MHFRDIENNGIRLRSAAGFSRRGKYLPERKGRRMPKALMLTTDQAIDRRILLEADALAAEGWEVTILALPGSGPDDPRVVRVGSDGTPSPARTEWAILRLYRFLRRFGAMNGPWANQLKSAVWRHLISPDEFARKIMLPEALRRRADVVIAHDLPILPTALAAASHHGAKLVYDSHELYCEQELEPRLRRMWSDIERRTIGACDAVITVNPSIARELEQSSTACRPALLPRSRVLGVSIASA